MELVSIDRGCSQDAAPALGEFAALEYAWYAHEDHA